jgi:membrane protease YdiL (CAAX protease family)
MTAQIYTPTLMQKLLGRSYKFTKQDYVFLIIITCFYILWTFRSWYGYEILKLETVNNFYWDVTKILWIPFSILLGFIAHKKNWISKLGLLKPKFSDLKYLIAGLFTLLFYIFTPYWFGLYDLNFSNWQIQFSIVDWFSAVVIIAFGEELLFRGFIFSWLESKFNALQTLILSSFLFSLVHYCWWVFTGIATFDAGFSVFITGLILGYFRLKSGSIYITTTLHFIFNIILIGFGF